MKKVSVIVPTFNNKETIADCLEALINQNYPQRAFEIIAVNDCSTDNTGEILKKYQDKAQNKLIKLRVINLKKNSGRAMARECGAKIANYQTLLFIDPRNIAKKNLITSFNKLNYQPILGNSIMNPELSPWDRTFYLLRSRFYRPYFGKKFKPLWISSANFDRAPKGTTIFFCSKKLFLNSQPRNKQSKNCADDTSLLFNIVQKKKILRHAKPQAFYLDRKSLKDNWLHIIDRGPKFVDYYFKPEKRFYKSLQLGFIITLILILLIILEPVIFVYLLFILTIIFFGISIYLSRDYKDFKALFFRLPIISLAFGLGIINGFLLKILRKY